MAMTVEQLIHILEDNYDLDDTIQILEGDRVWTPDVYRSSNHDCVIITKE